QWNTKENCQCLMIVGNDSAATEMLKEALGEWGYEIVTARNGWEALVLAGRRPVDGMLVDMNMPIMDGRTMLSELRWLGYRMPVLMMLGESDERIQSQLLMEGAQDFILKPPHLPSLQQTCRQVFSKYAVEEYATSYFPAGSNKK
ncbi:MAG TPA: response regulator, partial [Nitrospirales bacterium]|nr:response regulator [Nitrospirales bacterium]